MAFVSGEGITVGAHRLYSHKTFKAKFITRLILMILQTVAGQVRIKTFTRGKGKGNFEKVVFPVRASKENHEQSLLNELLAFLYCRRAQWKYYSSLILNKNAT